MCLVVYCSNEVPDQAGSDTSEQPKKSKKKKKDKDKDTE